MIGKGTVKPVFSIRLAELRKRRSINQTQLAEQIEMSHSTVASWETGTRDPNTSMILKLASFFNVSTDYLIGTTSDGCKLCGNKGLDMVSVIENDDVCIYCIEMILSDRIKIMKEPALV